MNNKRTEFYIKDKFSDIIDVYFSRDDLIKHLSSLVLKYENNKNIFIKTEDK